MKLAEHKGKKGTQIAAKLLSPILKMATNHEVQEVKYKDGTTINDVVAAMVTYEPDAAMEMFAILNEKDPTEYKNNVTAAEMLNNILEMFTDDEIMILFGLRVRKKESPNSTSAMESTGETETKKMP